MAQKKKTTKSRVKKADAAQPTNLNSMIDYQAGSIVSRTILDKKTGTVTLFAFDEGQRLSEHTAPFDALVYLVDGEGEFTIDGKPRTLAAGDLIVMPADHPHCVRAVKRFKMLLTMIRS